ncbi:MAG TPA: DUF4097 family beta strand repeat-containing protein [Micromonosporaceae bacterium]|jgi:hypothetical protein
MATWLVDGPQRLTFDDAVTALDVWLAHGKLHVVGTDGPARIEVRKVGRKGITVTHENGVLSVRHDVKHKWLQWGGPLWWFSSGRLNYSADVIIAVPPTVSGGLTVIAGDVIVSGLHEGARVDVTSGSIALMGLGGSVSARTVSGSIEAVGLSGDLSVETVSGEISLAGSFADRVHARTISGAVTCDLDNPYARDVHIDTVSGSITVRVPEDADLSVSLGATSGGVSSTFAQVQATKSMGTHAASGRIGAGSGRLRAYAVSGSVSLLASPPVGENAPAPDGEANQA